MKNDRNKWNARYSRHDRTIPDPDLFLVENSSILTAGTAVDVASGLGANALFLARHGYGVEAIDISFSALSKLKAEADRQRLNVRPIVADLNNYPLPPDRYDLAMIFYFFFPAIMSGIRNCLKSGGLLFCATYNYRHTSIMPEFNEKYLVPRGGLIPYIPDLEIVMHDGEAGEAGNLSRVIARKG